MKRPTTPSGFKASVDARLAARARSTRNTARLRNLWVMERWLARAVATSPGLFVLKGGLALELRLEAARTTKDVDLWMRGDARRMQAAVDATVAYRPEPDDFLTFTCVPDADTPTVADAIYEGYRFRAQATLAGRPYGDPFGVDIVFADPLTGSVEEFAFEPFLEALGIAPVRVPLYPIATHVAEKLHAWSQPRPEGRANSRLKDLIDLALLARHPVEPAAIAEACQRTFAARGSHALPLQVPACPGAWFDRYPKMKADHDLPWPDLAAALEVVAAWLDPVLARISGEGGQAG